MSERGLFRGHALQAIDAKGRVAIPASLRAVIERNVGERVLLIGLHPSEPCLTGGDTGLAQLDYARMQRAEERALDRGEPVDDGAARLAFGVTEELPFDASGRFIMPQFFRDSAGLADSAFFLGTGERFEIWNPQTLLQAAVPEQLKQVVNYHLSARA